MDFRDGRARVWWIVVGTLVVGAVALVVALMLPRTYTAEARVLISSSDPGTAMLSRSGSPAMLSPDRDMATEAEIVQSRPVAAAAIREADLSTTVGQLLDALTVSPVGQTNVLAVRASASTAETAARTANAVAHAYIESSTQAKRDSIGRAADKVQVRLDGINASIQDVRKKGLDEDRTTRTQTIQELADRHNVLALQLDQMRLAQASTVSSMRLIDEASADSQAVTPKPLRTLVLGLLVGLLASVAAVFAVPTQVGKE